MVPHNADATAKHGQSNGLHIMVDAEQFNYADNKATGTGFKIALIDHRDKPLMRLSSHLVHSGAEIQMNVKPLITYTTERAIAIFTPEDRDCYAEGEVNLTYLSHDLGYRYSMSNCAIDDMD